MDDRKRGPDAAAALWSFAVDIGRYAQPQDLFQVQIDDGLVELQDPQRNDQVGFSVERLGNKKRLQASFYYRHIHDPWSRFDNVYNPWVLLPELQPDRVELRASRARSWGAEMLASNLEGAAVRWSLSYTWAKTTERINRRNVPRPWEQRHSVKARAWVESSTWQLGVSVIGRSGWPTTPLLTNQAALDEQLYTDKLPDFWTVDVHAARFFRLGNLQGTAYIDISNTTNRANVGGFTYSLAEEEGQTAINFADAIRRDSKLLPVFPTLGLRVSW